jgi:hypothetical protein
MQCPTNKTSGVSAYKYKVIFSTLHSSLGHQLVRTLGLNCALIKTFKENKIFLRFWVKNTIKMKREVRRIHWYWYTAEKGKNNDFERFVNNTIACFARYSGLNK